MLLLLWLAVNNRKRGLSVYGEPLLLLSFEFM